MILGVPTATLELSNPAQIALIDDVEVGRPAARAVPAEHPGRLRGRGCRGHHRSAGRGRRRARRATDRDAVALPQLAARGARRTADHRVPGARVTRGARPEAGLRQGRRPLGHGVHRRGDLVREIERRVERPGPPIVMITEIQLSFRSTLRIAGRWSPSPRIANVAIGPSTFALRPWPLRAVTMAGRVAWVSGATEIVIALAVVVASPQMQVMPPARCSGVGRRGSRRRRAARAAEQRQTVRLELAEPARRQDVRARGRHPEHRIATRGGGRHQLSSAPEPTRPGPQNRHWARNPRP